jgi:hypothetical protein
MEQVEDKEAGNLLTGVGTITCSCGEVTITLPNPVPKFRCGCCCTDCLQRAYIGANGEPPEAIRNLEEAVDLLYVDSQIMKPSPETLARLSVFRLNTPDALNINLRAECCGSVLCTENEKFHVPHSMATFNNLRPSVYCEFAELPEPNCYVWTGDWPEEKAEALALKEKSTKGEALPQIFNVMTALAEKPIVDIASALQLEAPTRPEGVISLAELYADMDVKIEHAYFHESRAHQVALKS